MLMISCLLSFVLRLSQRALGRADSGMSTPYQWAWMLGSGSISGKSFYRTNPYQNQYVSPRPPGTDSIGSVAPVLAGPVAVLAQDGTVHGLRIADGRPLWAWHGGQAVYGMWRWGGLVAVLTDQVSSHARITGLDAATGAVRWVLRLPGSGLLGGQVAVGGGLAMIRSDGVLQVVSLATGRVRWARFAGRWPGLRSEERRVGKEC